MAVWFTSDTHFFHRNIIQYCSRPFALVEEMDRAMEDNWRSAVKPGDTVYHLGDFALGKSWVAAALLQSLPGRKVLIRGNHDKGIHRLTGPGMFEEVHDQLTVELDGRTILMCHYPYRPTPEELELARGNNYDIRYLERRPVDRGGILLCGHVHEKWKFKKRQVNVGVDVWGFTPVHEHTLISMINEHQEAYGLTRWPDRCKMVVEVEDEG